MDKYEEIMQLICDYGNERENSTFTESFYMYRKLAKEIMQLTEKLKQYEEASSSFLSQLDEVLNSREE